MLYEIRSPNRDLARNVWASRWGQFQSDVVKCGEIKVTNVKSVKYAGIQKDNALSGISVI